jgi:hypothetical protein
MANLEDVVLVRRYLFLDCHDPDHRRTKNEADAIALLSRRNQVWASPYYVRHPYGKVTEMFRVCDQFASLLLFAERKLGEVG